MGAWQCDNYIINICLNYKRFIVAYKWRVTFGVDNVLEPRRVSACVEDGVDDNFIFDDLEDNEKRKFIDLGKSKFF